MARKLETVPVQYVSHSELQVRDTHPAIAFLEGLHLQLAGPRDEGNWVAAQVDGRLVPVPGRIVGQVCRLYLKVDGECVEDISNVFLWSDRCQRNVLMGEYCGWLIHNNPGVIPTSYMWLLPKLGCKFPGLGSNKQLSIESRHYQ